MMNIAGSTTTTADHAILPKNAGVAKTDDILREQLEYLIDHAGEKVELSCSECRRYLRVRSLLLQVFRTSTESARAGT
jgi:hypothetical protein